MQVSLEPLTIFCPRAFRSLSGDDLKCPGPVLFLFTIIAQAPPPPIDIFRFLLYRVFVRRFRPGTGTVRIQLIHSRSIVIAHGCLRGGAVHLHGVFLLLSVDRFFHPTPSLE